MTVNELYDLAEKNKVEIYDFPLYGRKALSLPLEDGVCAVAMDTFRLTANDEKAVLAHELGHCMTHTFYSPSTPMVTRARCENRAMKWAVRHLITEDELVNAIAQNRQPWEIAEMYELDEETVYMAMELYYYGHL